MRRDHATTMQRRCDDATARRCLSSPLLLLRSIWCDVRVSVVDETHVGWGDFHCTSLAAVRTEDTHLSVASNLSVISQIHSAKTLRLESRTTHGEPQPTGWDGFCLYLCTLNEIPRTPTGVSMSTPPAPWSSLHPPRCSTVGTAGRAEGV